MITAITLWKICAGVPLFIALCLMIAVLVLFIKGMYLEAIGCCMLAVAMLAIVRIFV